MTGAGRSLEAGRLYVVATPIGNLGDMTYRAVQVLKEVSLIAAEDTRHSKKLLQHFQITTRLVSYHEHNEHQKVAPLLARLHAGEDIALISDAGTPGIADPGFRLVKACHAAGIDVVAVPGASALIAALSIAGVPTDRFAFEGFLPAKIAARRTLLQKSASADHTLVFYEVPHRLLSTLELCEQVLGTSRHLVVVRELTKLHENVFRGTVAEALAHYGGDRVRGELVLIVPPDAQSPKVAMPVALRRMMEESDLSRREIVKIIAREYGLSGSDVYRESLKYSGGKKATADE